MLAPFLILVQVCLLISLNALARIGARGRPLNRYFNPVGWVSLFYFLFFVLPQIYGVFNDYYMVGWPPGVGASRPDSFVLAQQYCIYFLAALFVGVLLVQVVLPPPVASTARLSLAPAGWMTPYLVGLVAAGVLANMYLGSQFQEIDGFRSELVKGLPGRLATAVALAGGFGFGVLGFMLLLRRRVAMYAGLLVVFGYSVVLTGSRGRLLWPLAITLMLLASERGSIRWGRTILVGVVMFVALLGLDPLIEFLRSGDSDGFGRAFDAARLFEKRNFDGFSNFALIVGDGSIEPDVGYLVSGARDVFMTTYFPVVYDFGVGFGASVPGWFFVVGGLPLLGALAMGYGVVLQMINRWLSVTTDPVLVYGYLFAMTWMAAVGGNFMESIDKMVVAFAPAIGLFVARLVAVRRDPERGPEDPDEPGGALTPVPSVATLSPRRLLVGSRGRRYQRS